MLSAKRKSDGQTVAAYSESKANAPFVCLVCGDEVVLKTGRSRISHFAHVNPLACRYADRQAAHLQGPAEPLPGLDGPDRCADPQRVSALQADAGHGAIPGGGR